MKWFLVRTYFQVPQSRVEGAKHHSFEQDVHSTIYELVRHRETHANKFNPVFQTKNSLRKRNQEISEYVFKCTKSPSENRVKVGLEWLRVLKNEAYLNTIFTTNQWHGSGKSRIHSTVENYNANIVMTGKLLML